MGWSAVAGMGLGEISKGVHNLVAKNWSRAAYDRAKDDARENYQHRYQWTMQDMKKAGLNPILAYRGTGGGVPSVGNSISSGGGGSSQNVGDVASAIGLRKKTGNLQEAQLQQATSAAAANRAQEKKLRFEAAGQALKNEDFNMTLEQYRNNENLRKIRAGRDAYGTGFNPTSAAGAWRSMKGDAGAALDALNQWMAK